ncbi:MAG TPA: competence/damage-inducible protein A [Ignavibacteria bacterium]
MKAAILTIGDEVLIGQVINTNASYISRQLFSIGIPVERVVTIPDTEKDIISEFRKAFSAYDIVIATGGLGPTHDDITIKCIAIFFKMDLILHKPTLNKIKKSFRRRKLVFPENNIAQAMMPSSAEIFENKAGSAPGILLKKRKKIFFAMPGVPHEMELITRNHLIPYLQKHKIKSRNNGVLIQRTLHTIGIPESLLSKKLGNLNEIVRRNKSYELKLAFLPSNYEVRLRITISANTTRKANELINSAIKLIKQRAGNYIYSTDESPIEQAVGKLLKRKKLTIAIAESCTGGLVCSKLTNISGSADYLMNGIVSYSNESKKRLLGVKQQTLKTYGAVSERVAKEMADGIRKRSKTDIGISTTGIAGPTGATPGKPVGLVWIGYSDKDVTFAKDFIFTKDRLRNKEIMSKMALEIVRRKLLKIEIR